MHDAVNERLKGEKKCTTQMSEGEDFLKGFSSGVKAVKNALMVCEIDAKR